MDARTAKAVQAEWTAEKLHAALAPVSQEQLQAIRQLPAAPLRALLEKAALHAEKARKESVDGALKKMQATVDAEIHRLKALQGKNQLVSQSEIEWWQKRREKLSESFERARVRLDCFLLVLG